MLLQQNTETPDISCFGESESSEGAGEGGKGQSEGLKSGIEVVEEFFKSQHRSDSKTDTAS